MRATEKTGQTMQTPRELRAYGQSGPRAGAQKASRGRRIWTLPAGFRRSREGDVEQRFPAERYVLVDDKLRILTAVKKIWGARVTTVFPRQGHYALDPAALATYPPADLSIDRIGDLLVFGAATLLAAATESGAADRSKET